MCDPVNPRSLVEVSPMMATHTDGVISVDKSFRMNSRMFSSRILKIAGGASRCLNIPSFTFHFLKL